MVEANQEPDTQRTSISEADQKRISTQNSDANAPATAVNSRNEIRVLFLGDESVGKTSIIHYIVTDMFPKNVKKMFKTTVLDSDVYLLETKIKTVLIDSSTSKDHIQQTDMEVERASVIILVYDVNNFDIIKRLRTFWLPRIVKLNEKVPVILCGNKMDLRSSNSEGELESLLTPCCQEFRQAEMGIECSAKQYLGLSDIINCAQNAVLYPIAPLHDSCSKMLRPDFDKALLRIFRILDVDNDGYLSDEELTNFQQKVFSVPLKKNYITALKELLVLECDDFDEQQALKGITYEAFKTFQKILIRKLKMEVCWTILRYFGYDNELKIVKNLWDDGSIPDEDLAEARAFELKKDCLQFLATIFRTHRPSRSKIDVQAIERIFATTEVGVCPWDVLKQTAYEGSRAANFGLDQNEQNHLDHQRNDASGGISIENWIGLWNKYFHSDVKAAFRDLVYIGYCGQLADAIQPIRARPRDIFGVPPTRKTFNCLLVGASGSGKSTFMDAFIMAKNANEEHKEAIQASAGGPGANSGVSEAQLLGGNSARRLTELRSVVKAIKEKDPKNKDKYNIKYLTMTEVPEELISSGALFDDQSSENQSFLKKCDAIIYIFESNDAEQVDYIKRANDKFKESQALAFVPTILLQSKMDLQMPESGENRSMLGQTFANELQIKVYKEMCAGQGEITEAVDSIMMTCNEPQCGLSEAEITQAREMQSGLSVLDYFQDRPLMSASIVTLVAASLSVIIYMIKNKA